MLKYALGSISGDLLNTCIIDIKHSTLLFCIRNIIVRSMARFHINRS